MPQHKTQGFTLVELIVVVTILAILATIGFVSYSSYLTGVRDTNRIAQLTSISDGLNLYSTKNDLPIPDNNVEVSVSGALIAYQGTAGANTLDTIDFSKGGKDPKDDTHFSYYLTKNRKYFQLMAFLEESENLTSGIINSTHAIDYTDRIPTVSGKKLGILTNDAKVPIEQLGSNVDVGTTTEDYKAYLTSEDVIEGDSSVLFQINPEASCKRIKQMKGGSQDGVYTINPTGTNEIQVYCDMTTDGGGWTFFMFVDDDTTNGDFFETPTGTYSVSREDTGSVYSLSSDIFSHTEMMVTLGTGTPSLTTPVPVPSPTSAEEANKIVFYKYDEGHSGFNSGPNPCVGLTGYSYKLESSGDYQTGGSSTCTTHWYTVNAAGSYITLLYGTQMYGHYWGTGMGNPGTQSWNHNGWWYLR